ncbi:ATP synthase delta chain, chloroplastic-like [Nymphaea colorata]|uniref:ATP synthase delta chain, chloroplastic n=1 Tax=Nymphaea colorata TaxID=210225 RepID=A0A5K0ZZU5_9MAGN|nr:ATP synthase delta chain, chloroplastic-like [Nymphaea colorata]
MDALPSSSTLIGTGIRSSILAPRPNEHTVVSLRPSAFVSPSSHLASTASSFHTKPSSATRAAQQPVNNFPQSSSQYFLPSARGIHCHRAATGYAAALVDIAQLDNAIDRFADDVSRLRGLLRSSGLHAILVDPSIEGPAKKGLVRAVAGLSDLHKRLVFFLNMIIDKGKVGLVGEILKEFEKIYDELSGTMVVMVASRKKLEEEEALKIAQMVQRRNGAKKVKVKNVVNEMLHEAYAVN